jgi:hypothetical protein
MSIYLGVPTSSKLATSQFYSIGQNYRKPATVKDLALRITYNTLSSIFYLGLSCVYGFLLGSYFLERPVLFKEHSGELELSDLATVHDDLVIDLSFITLQAVPATLVKEYKMETINPGGRYTNGYFVEKIKMIEVPTLLAKLSRSDIEVIPTGIRNKGISIDTAKSLRNMGRLTNALLRSQPIKEDYGDLQGKEYGFGELTIENIEIHNLSASDELLPALRLFGGKKEDFEERSFKPAFVAGPSKKKMRGAGGLEF